MRKNNVGLYVAAVLMTLLATACSKESTEFNQDNYDLLLKETFAVGDIDRNHKWATVATAQASIGVTGVAGTTYQVGIYLGNPVSDAQATLLCEGQLRGSGVWSPTFCYLIDEPQVYVGVFNTNGQGVAQAATIENGFLTAVVDVTDSQASQTTGSRAETVPFAMRYCFEDNFPSPGDFDFNDLVLTVTPTVSGKVLTLTVSLDAVGTLATLGAAIRLIGAYRTTAKVVSGFAKPSFGNYLNIETGEDFVNYGRDKVAILFKDAHWAINPVEAARKTGSPDRVYYNTQVNQNGGKVNSVSKKTATYTFTFDTEEDAQAMLSDKKYDVFVVTSSGFEIHTVQNNFKLAAVLKGIQNKEAFDKAYKDNVPWAIVTPSFFKYPIEGAHIGPLYDSGRYGPYQTTGHSFAEWAQNRRTATDWYRFYKRGYVYEE